METVISSSVISSTSSISQSEVQSGLSILVGLTIMALMLVFIPRK